MLPIYVSDRRMAGHATRYSRRTHHLSDQPSVTTCSRETRWMARVAAPTGDYPLCAQCHSARVRQIAAEISG